MSDLDGSNERQVSPPGIKTAPAGTSRTEVGGTYVYYISEDSDTDRSLWRFDPATSETTMLVQYQDTPGEFYGDVSPDGAHFAHTEPLGLDLYDFASATTKTLFAAGSGSDCVSGTIAQCYSWIAPQWSPDGKLLLVVHSVYEGGWVEVIDPFQSPPAVYTQGSREYPSGGEWSPDSSTVCAQGQYGNTSSLYLLEAPDWEARRVTGEYEDYTQNPDGHGVLDCGWLNDDTVYLAERQQPQLEAEVNILFQNTGDTRLITTLPATSCCSGRLVVPDGGRVAVAQLYGGSSGGYGWLQPSEVNLDSGAATPILHEGDVIAGYFRD